MTKIILLICCITSVMFLHGCSQVLESVLLTDGSKDVKEIGKQEDFNVVIKSLTFKNAQKASKNDAYPRRLMLTGIGSEANVFDEADFLDSSIPPSFPSTNYLLGIGDRLTFQQLNEFEKLQAAFPVPQTKGDYVLGVGDELTLMQLSDEPNHSINALNGNTKIIQSNDGVLKSSGIIGTNGNILLLGLGSIEAENKSLNSIQTEIRNILIRNGLAPNFQLEITGFNSKKAFVTFKDLTNEFGENVVPITNLPITLKEVLLNYGIQPTSRERLITTLIRNGQKYHITAGQLFDSTSPPVVIENRDQIEISVEKLSITEPIEAVVGSNGNILLPNIGRLNVLNRSLADVHADVTQILLQQGMVPSFQLEISNFESKRFFLVIRGKSSRVIKLTNYKLSLKEAILSAELGDNTEFTVINLKRGDSNYQMTFKEMLNELGAKVIIQDGDMIELKGFKYKPGQVFALAGAGKAQMVPIDPSKRETLADILFTSSGALNNLLARRSEVYLVRGQNPSVAYHLDAQNVSRILVAAKMELRPNDIVYVAERPIISFSRTLSEILPLRVLLRDIKNDSIP